jgi:hypothetical protein
MSGATTSLGGSRRAIMLALIALAACARTPGAVPSRPAPTDAAGEIGSAAADASAATIPDAAVTAALPPAPCEEVVLQPGACAPARGDLTDDALHAWFDARGVKVEPAAYEACHEIAFGPQAEHALVCTSITGLVFDKALGIAGPFERRRDVAIVAVRQKRTVELVRLPLDFSDVSLLLFSARYVVDAAAGTLDLQISPEECGAARTALGPHWDGEIRALRDNDSIEAAFKRQLVRATEVERTSDLQRINATCSAAGHYVPGADVRLTRSR